MPSTAATYEIRWRIADIAGVPGAWSSKIVPANTSAIRIEGLERGRAYEGEARAVSAAGAASDWEPIAWTVDDPTLAPRTPTGLTALPVADAVSLKWGVDTDQPADVEYSIEAAAAAVGPFSEFTRTRAQQYSIPFIDSTVRWFRVRAVNFGVVYSPYSNTVSAAAISIADLEAEAAAALAAANAANAKLADIASDNLLTQGEKPQVIRDRDVLVAEQAGLDAQAVAYAITTEKTNYDAAVIALTSYLATLTTPVLWSDLSGNTGIVGTTFRQKFADVFASKQTLLNKIVERAKAIANASLSGDGKNLVPNSNFSKNSLGKLNYTDFTAGEVAADGWKASGSNSVQQMGRDPNGTLYIVTRGGSIANGALYYADYRSEFIPVVGGQKYVREGKAVAFWDTNPPAGVSRIVRFNVLWYTAAGAFISESLSEASVTSSGAAIVDRAPVTAPANATQAIYALAAYGFNASGSTYNIVGLPFDCYFSYAGLYANISLDDEVNDGVSYVRYGIEDAIFTSGKWRNGTRFNSSGQQIGGIYNFPPGGFANVGSVWISGATINYTATAGSPATATISCSAMTLRSMGSDKAYSASSVGVNGTNGTTTTFHLYYDDDAYAGGARTLGASTSMDTIQSSRSRLYVGSIPVSFPSSGSGGGSGRPQCPTVESWLACGRRAGRIRIADLLRLADPSDGLRARMGRVSGATPAIAPCVRLTTDRGAVFEGSTSAPIPTREGYRNAPDTLGCEVAIRRIRWSWLRPLAWLLRNQSWAWSEGWELVDRVDDIGERWVMHITCENACFWVGKRLHAMFLHHNIKYDPPP